MITEVERSRQMAAVGEFAAELSHEIRNPLTSVKLNLQRVDRLRAQDLLPAAAEGPLRISLREVDRLERVVRGVLTLGRPRARERVRLSLHALLRDTLEALRPDAERPAVALEHDFAASRDAVSGDPSGLRAAVLDLCANALNAMPEAGPCTSRRRSRARTTLHTSFCACATPAPAFRRTCASACSTPSSRRNPRVRDSDWRWRRVPQRISAATCCSKRRRMPVDFRLELPLDAP